MLRFGESVLLSELETSRGVTSDTRTSKPCTIACCCARGFRFGSVRMDLSLFLLMTSSSRCVAWLRAQRAAIRPWSHSARLMRAICH
jgi:hypothetical protein